MKVLFIGGTGLISSACSALAVARGMDVTLLNRGARSEHVPEGAKVITADIRDREDAAAALKGQTFDVVCNFIGMLPEQVADDVALFGGGIKQYIYISTAAVYQKPPSYYIIDESTPLCNPYWQYAQNKIACEELLTAAYRKNGFPMTIVRPSLTYADFRLPGFINSRKGQYTFFDRIRQGKKVIVQGDGTALWTTTHNTDFAKGFVGLMGNWRAIGHAFHITTDEVLTWNQMVETVAMAMGVKANICHIASDYLGRVMPNEAPGLIGDKSQNGIFDNSKIKRFVPDYRATVTFAQGVERVLNWYDSHPEAKIIDDEWNDFVDKTVAQYETIFD